MFGMGCILGYGSTLTVITPLSVLGSRLKCEWANSYSGGTWTDDIAGEVIGQDTAGFRPTTTTTPNGATALVYDGVDDVVVSQYSGNGNAYVATLNALPAIGTGERLMYFILKVPSTGGHKYIYAGSVSSAVFVDGTTGAIGVDKYDGGVVHLTTTTRVDDDAWHRIIVLTHESTPVTTVYVDGVAEATTGSFAFGNAAEWGDSLFVGFTYTGSLGRLGFAYTSGAFGADINNLDLALQSVIG